MYRLDLQMLIIYGLIYLVGTALLCIFIFNPYQHSFAVECYMLYSATAIISTLFLSLLVFTYNNKIPKLSLTVTIAAIITIIVLISRGFTADFDVCDIIAAVIVSGGYLAFGLLGKVEQVDNWEEF